MKLRIRVDLSFEPGEEQHLTGLKNAAVAAGAHAVNINEGDDNEEIGFVRVTNCYHDESPPSPCEVTYEWLVGQ